MDLQDKVGGFTARKVKRMQVVKKKLWMASFKKKKKEKMTEEEKFQRLYDSQGSGASCDPEARRW